MFNTYILLTYPIWASLCNTGLSSFPKLDKPPQLSLSFDRNPFLQAARLEGLQDLGKVLWNMKIACAGLSADAVSERELNTSCLTFRDMQPPGPTGSSSILQKARETPSRKSKSPFKNQKDDTVRFQDRVAQRITRNILNQSKRKFLFNTQKDDVSRALAPRKQHQKPSPPAKTPNIQNQAGQKNL